MRYIIPLVDGVYTEGDSSITTEGTRNDSATHKVIVALNGAPADGKLTIQFQRVGSSRWEYVDYTNLSEVESQKIEFSGSTTKFRFIVEGASGTGAAVISDTERGEALTPYGLFDATDGMTPAEVGFSLRYSFALSTGDTLPVYLSASLDDSGGRANLSWSNPESVSLFNIYSNGNLVGTSATNSFNYIVDDGRNEFSVAPVVGGIEGEKSNVVVVDGGAVTYIAPETTAESRIYHPVLSREGRHYTISSTSVSGDWSLAFEGYIGVDSNAYKPDGAVISGWVDADNYFAIGTDIDGKLYHEQSVSGVVTRSTDPDVYVDKTLDYFNMSRTGSTLTIETRNTLRTFTVPTDDFTIDTILGRTVSGAFTDATVGSIKSLEFSNDGTTLINSAFDEDLSGGTDIANSGTAGVITAVSIPSAEVINFSIEAGALEWDSSPFNHLGADFDLTLSNASQGDIVGGTTNYNTRVVDGVFSQRFEAEANTTTGGIKIIYGYNGPSLYVGETGPVEWPGANTGRVYFTSPTDSNTGVIDNLSATPFIEQSDPRETYTIVHLGDSITNYMILGNQGDYRNLAESTNNIKLEIVNEGVGGHTIVDMANRLPGLLTDQSGKKRVLFVIMAGSNWVDGQTVEEYSDVLRGMVNDVFDAGFECAVMNRTANINNNSLADEPSVNTQGNNVVCRELTPAWFNFDSGRPYLDGFSFLLGGQNEDPSWFRDNLHPSEEGEQVLINNVAPIVADRVWRLFG